MNVSKQIKASTAFLCYMRVLYLACNKYRARYAQVKELVATLSKRDDNQ